MDRRILQILSMAVAPCGSTASADAASATTNTRAPVTFGPLNTLLSHQRRDALVDDFHRGSFAADIQLNAAELPVDASLLVTRSNVLISYRTSGATPLMTQPFLYA
jgi:hypothetical protein